MSSEPWKGRTSRQHAGTLSSSKPGTVLPVCTFLSPTSQSRRLENESSRAEERFFTSGAAAWSQTAKRLKGRRRLCPACSPLRTSGRERLPSPNNLPSIRGSIPARQPSQSGAGRERRRTQVPIRQISREILHPPPPHLAVCRPINRLHQLQRKRLIAGFWLLSLAVVQV